MNVFGLEPDAFQEAEKNFDFILCKTSQSPIQKLQKYIQTIQYDHTEVTLIHKTVLFLLNKKGLNVNTRYFHDPVFFECGKSYPESNQHPGPHTIQLLQFLIDDCEMNVHMIETFGMSYIQKIVESLNYDTKVKMEILELILEKGNWIQYSHQLQNALLWFMFYSLRFFKDYYVKKAFILLLSFCSESIVQGAQAALYHSFPENFIQNGRQKAHIKICTMLFQCGFLAQDKNKLLNVVQEGEICQYYSFFI